MAESETVGPVRISSGARDSRGVRVRREALLARIHERGEGRVGALAAEVGASEVTVRRDLAELERQGLVDRTWGGARPHVALRYRGDHLERAARGEAAKRAVATAAARLVAPNMVVALSGGTTLTLLARMLRGRPLNVVTNAVNVAAELHGSRATKVIVTGGALKADAYELVGAAADAIIRAYHVDLAFCSCSGVDEAGYGRRDHAEAAIVRAFRRAAARTVMLIDREKLGRGYRARVAALGEVDQVIVDGPLPPAWRERLAAGRTDLIEVAPCDTGAS
jgi:DeoR family transcriptional regulator, aga operon transcriptional repressor